MDIDDLLGNLHNDRLASVTEQVGSLEQQILKRRLQSIELSSTLIAQITELTVQINNLQPEGGMPDTRRREREPLERERRDRQVQLESEAIQQWRDTQLLRQEGRHTRKEAREETQRYDRISEALYDTRPQ